MSQSQPTPDGGCAFPVPHQEDASGNVRQWGELGMTLRDYFAAKALSGLVVNGDNFVLPKLAAYCYEMADEMLKARTA